jgi:lipopolysaccharide/colanic/teichoic acid biosynthesis glycosyltransferase
MIRRIVHGAMALGGLVVLAPVLALVAVAVKLDDGGPVLFLQERVGWRGRPFRMWKFRTMRNDPQAGGTPLTVGRDPRITRVGAFLRRSRLDELPQLVNVVLGHMVLVGPRPEVPRYVARYTPEQRRVLQLVPGITDLASIVFREEATLLARAADPEAAYVHLVVPEKIRINLAYAARAGFVADVRVILNTLAALLGREWGLPEVAAAPALTHRPGLARLHLPPEFHIAGERPGHAAAAPAEAALSDA